MDFKQRHKLRNSVLYTLLKYMDTLDFTPIADKDILAYRYFCCALVKLKYDLAERTKNGLNKK